MRSPDCRIADALPRVRQETVTVKPIVDWSKRTLGDDLNWRRSWGGHRCGADVLDWFGHEGAY